MLSPQAKHLVLRERTRPETQCFVPQQTVSALVSC